ncbi:hypothetical protein COCVIDRAFT_114222 [Bipolaris victoriae FI3]|uniref:Uncharacterized protein n=2 Tax=Bipolaris TaxID=33194 RepID=W6YJP7_COCC2|nr:uncharacterized protein COCCADRAFT_84554 [Bipolaris zeicola 26-R-13]XP_014550906.1 hypothetical protein COCVIDRAFT_114222 [Bipolaris victoriae FI3]EUC37810.1 hypothetical protein COCCADRAFT_84554 [Bipolaris zeicola 26-R-13]
MSLSLLDNCDLYSAISERRSFSRPSSLRTSPVLVASSSLVLRSSATSLRRDVSSGCAFCNTSRISVRSLKRDAASFSATDRSVCSDSALALSSANSAVSASRSCCDDS